ncbi:hypothetical protein [[Mycoplasma] testudinis]|uniref:hypothetical protein n=1 Tax=[Mycoplasma] testudinis TaxID=33924 RepID=UPI000489BF5E|nr:hypothetical protein [[Mycoplasma] testudinis]
MGLKDILHHENNVNLLYFSITTFEDITNSKAVADIIMQNIMQNANFNQQQNRQALLLFDEYSASGSN